MQLSMSTVDYIWLEQQNALTPSLALWLKCYYVLSTYVRTNTFTHSSVNCRQGWTALQAHFLPQYTTWKMNVAVLQQAWTLAWCNTRLSVSSQDMSDGFRAAGTTTNSYEKMDQWLVSFSSSLVGLFNMCELISLMLSCVVHRWKKEYFTELLCKYTQRDVCVFFLFFFNSMTFPPFTWMKNCFFVGVWIGNSVMVQYYFCSCHLLFP